MLNDYIDIFRRYIFLCIALFADHRHTVGARIVAQPGIQLGKQFAAGVELSGVSRELYCSG